MGKIFDGADYNRRLDGAANVTVGTELKYIIRGEADVPVKMMAAKQAALLKARKKLLKAIQDERRKRLENVIPVEVEEVLTGTRDELVQV